MNVTQNLINWAAGAVDEAEDGDDNDDDDDDDDDGEYVIAWRHFRLAPWESHPPLRRENTDVSIQSRAL